MIISLSALRVVATKSGVCGVTPPQNFLSYNFVETRNDYKNSRGDIYIFSNFDKIFSLLIIPISAPFPIIFDYYSRSSYDGPIRNFTSSNKQFLRFMRFVFYFFLILLLALVWMRVYLLTALYSYAYNKQVSELWSERMREGGKRLRLSVFCLWKLFWRWHFLLLLIKKVKRIVRSKKKKQTLLKLDKLRLLFIFVVVVSFFLPMFNLNHQQKQQRGVSHDVNNKTKVEKQQQIIINFDSICSLRVDYSNKSLNLVVFHPLQSK